LLEILLPWVRLGNMDAGTARPERLGQYEVVETLALGSMWRTYKGFDPMLRQSVALKTVAKQILDRHGAGVISRIQNEARAAAGRRHPRIVRVYGYDEDCDLAFVAMEYVEGRSLKERFRVPVADAVGLGLQLLEALDYGRLMLAGL
jgi:serine/threonine-protein kinase